MRWIAKVKYLDWDGKIQEKEKSYQLHVNSRGKAIPLDRTRAIRDLVPAGCEAVRGSLRVSKVKS